MYKNQLQELAQRSCFNLPAYACIREGPDHAPRFKATVNFNGEVFESPNYCSTLRQAEHSAAEVALNTLSKRGPSQALAARILDETGVYKNLLQEIAQRAGANLPIYTTVRSGLGHLPVFTCTVELAGINFVGDAAKNKKQAEKNAAMAAWSSLRLLPQQMGLCTSAGEGEYNDEQEQITIAKALAIHRADDIAMAQQLKQQQSLARRRMIFQRESSTVNSTGNLALTQWNSSDMLESSSRFTHSPHHQQHHNTTTSTSSPTSKFLPFIRSILSQASTNTNRALTLPEPNMSSSIASNRPSSSPHNSSSSISLGSNKPSSSYISNRPSSASHNSFSSIAFSSNKSSSSHIPTSLGSSNRPSSTHTSSNGATLGSSRPSSSHAPSSSNRPTSSHQNEHLPMVLARESRAPMRPTTSIQPMQHRASTQNIHIPFEEHQRDEEEWLRGDNQRSTTSIQSMQHRASTQSIHIAFEEHQRDEEEWLRGDTKTQQNNHVSAMGGSKMADWSVGSTMLSAWSNSNSAESWKFQREQWMQHHKQQEEQQTIHSTSSFVRSGCRSSTSSLVAPPVNIRTSRPVCAAPPVRIRSVGDASMKPSSTTHGATDMNMIASSTIHGANDVNMRLPSNIHGATDVNARPRRSIHAVPSVQIRSVVPVYAAPPQRQLPTRPGDDVQDHIPLEKDEEDRTMQLLNELRL